MSNLYTAADYKYKIINLLLKNKNFIKLISPEESECPELDIVDVLLGGKCTLMVNGIQNRVIFLITIL